MESYLVSAHYDLITPDGMITKITPISPGKLEVIVYIKNISPAFLGYQIDESKILFNLKSTLAQLGVNSRLLEINFESKLRIAHVRLELHSIGKLAEEFLQYLTTGAFIGKLFAADDRRRVRDPHYLTRMFSRLDEDGTPLLSLGKMQGSELLTLEVVDGRTVAYLTLQDGVLVYDKSIKTFLPTLARALHQTDIPVRNLLHMYQKWVPNAPKIVTENEILLVRTLPLHIRTVFGKVVDELLTPGFHHTSASILQPDTKASGDVYELFGSSKEEISEIPMEFYTLEPHREYIFFSDRDQLKNSLEKPEVLFKAYETCTAPLHFKASVFVVKGDQLLNLSAKDWIVRQTHTYQLPGLNHPERQANIIEHYIEQQPAFPFLKAIENNLITSQGIMINRYFPSPMMKRFFLSDRVRRCLKALYFQYPSLSNGDYFSHEDRSFLFDLSKFAIPVYWVDKTSNRVLQYIPKPGKDTGMFVPLELIDDFIHATTFGIYGSNLRHVQFEKELSALLKGILDMRPQMNHPLLHANTPLALITGGGPGVMESANKIAKDLGILSCANIVNFNVPGTVVNEQRANPYIDAKMTYRIDRLVERQAEFNLDFPIILMGGIGTDFEFALEELRRKVGGPNPTPVILLGDVEYWTEKISHSFQCNIKSGTISGTEWVSNCFFCVQTATQALKVFQQFFSGTLLIGPKGPVYEQGFVIV